VLSLCHPKNIEFPVGAGLPAIAISRSPPCSMASSPASRLLQRTRPALTRRHGSGTVRAL